MGARRGADSGYIVYTIELNKPTSAGSLSNCKYQKCLPRSLVLLLVLILFLVRAIRGIVIATSATL